MGVRQNPWTPTKRRGPIAAEAASPGPAVVALPTLIGKLTHLLYRYFKIKRRKAYANGIL